MVQQPPSAADARNLARARAAGLTDQQLQILTQARYDRAAGQPLTVDLADFAAALHHPAARLLDERFVARELLRVQRNKFPPGPAHLPVGG